MSCSTIGNINSAVQLITDLVNNKDKVYEIIQLLENQLIGPMKKESEKKINVSTQTNDESKNSLLYVFYHILYSVIKVNTGIYVIKVRVTTR